MAFDAKKHFSYQTRAVLAEAGWHESREFDVSSYVLELEARGYTLFPAVRNFLECFGGLVLIFGLRSALRNVPDWNWIRLDPTLPKRDEWIQVEYSARVGSALYPLGWADRNDTVLVMGTDGRVFGGRDHTLFTCGASGVQALEFLIAGKGEQSTFIPRLPNGELKLPGE